MKPRTVALGLLCAPLVWLYGFGVALAALAADLLALVRGRAPRDPALDRPPPARNASVIVLSYDGERFLRELLPTLEVAVQRAPGQHEIIVVDNGSRDGTAGFVAQHHPSVRLVRLPENRFFIRGNRAGVEAARGDVLVFVNNDMRVEPDFLAALLARFDAGDVFAVTARIEMAGERVETGRTRAYFRRGALHFVQVDGPRAEVVPALWAGGGSSAFDRRKWDALGGFEALYEPCYVEDVSLSYQAWKRGWRVLYEPASVVHHAHQGTSAVVFGSDGPRRLAACHRELFFWRSFTDPRMVLEHAFWLPWNVMKRADASGFGLELGALWAGIPRLPHALGARLRARAHERRSDAEVLRIANHVRRHRESLELPRRELIALSVGVSDGAPLPPPPGFAVAARTIPVPERDGARPCPLAAMLSGVPPAMDAVCDGAFSDAVRDTITETDHDVVLFRDVFALAATPPGLTDGRAVLWLEGLPADRARCARRLAHRVAFVACADEAIAQALGTQARCVVVGGDGALLAQVCRRAIGAGV